MHNSEPISNHNRDVMEEKIDRNTASNATRPVERLNVVLDDQLVTFDACKTECDPDGYNPDVRDHRLTDPSVKVKTEILPNGHEGSASLAKGDRTWKMPPESVGCPQSPGGNDGYQDSAHKGNELLMEVKDEVLSDDPEEELDAIHQGNELLMEVKDESLSDDPEGELDISDDDTALPAVKESSVPSAVKGIKTTVKVCKAQEQEPHEIQHEKEMCDTGGINQQDDKYLTYYGNAAQNMEKQKITSHLEYGRVYFRATTDIPADTELLVDNGQNTNSKTLVDLLKSTPGGCDNALQKEMEGANDDVLTRNGSGQDDTGNESKQKPFPKRKRRSKDLPWQCSICDITFPDFRAYRQHMKIHPFRCATCGATFRTSSHLNRHMKIHTGEKPFKCTSCGKCFSRAFHLVTHERIHTGQRPYQCPTCGKDFRQSSGLQEHVKIHLSEKAYKCPICGKKFSTGGSLTSHLRVHTGEKPYKCSTCDKTFTQSSSLAKHRRIHNGDEPFKCLTCGKTFRWAHSLQVHLKRHTGEKAFKCPTCGKAFVQMQQLRAHERIHTGERPYKCLVCGKAFTQSSGLHTHRKIHTRDNAQQIQT